MKMLKIGWDKIVKVIIWLLTLIFNNLNQQKNGKN